MRAVLGWLLRRIAGPALARDIEGDVVERGGGLPPLAALVLSTLIARVQHVGVSLWRSAPGGRRSGTDLGYSIRSLRRAPAYALAVIVVIGLTGALSMAAFAIVDGVLFRRLPIPTPETLYAANGPGGGALSLADLDEWRRAAPDAALALYGPDFVIGAIGMPRPRPVVAISVERAFFDVLGERPAAGGFRDTDFDGTTSPVRLIISDRLWRAAFGARPDVIGQRLDMAGAADHMRRPIGPFEVAGVLPPDFVFPVNRSTPDVILPMVPPSARMSSRNDARNHAAGRALIRTPHAGPALPAALAAAYGNAPLTAMRSDTGATTFALTPISRYLTMWQRDNLASAFAACAVLMLLAIVNVAALGVLRGRQQLTELGVRRALGATHLDLFRLALTDAAPLVLGGMVLALLLTPWLIAAALSRLSDSVALLKVPTLDWRVMALWAVLVAVTIVCVALVRTIAVRPGTIAATSRAGQCATPRRARFGMVAVAVQVALALVITVGGALVAGSLWRLWQEPIGYSLSRTLLIELSHESTSSAARRAVTMSLMDRLRSTAGVEGVASVEGAPFLTGSRRSSPFERLPPATSPSVRLGVWPVDGAYFSLLGVPLLAGRVFTPEEITASAPVIVLSDSVARRLFPEGGAVQALRED